MFIGEIILLQLIHLVKKRLIQMLFVLYTTHTMQLLYHCIYKAGNVESTSEGFPPLPWFVGNSSHMYDSCNCIRASDLRWCKISRNFDYFKWLFKGTPPQQQILKPVANFMFLLSYLYGHSVAYYLQLFKQSLWWLIQATPAYDPNKYLPRQEIDLFIIIKV